MRFAYADPPYLGMGQSMYGYPEWDKPERHLELLASLAEYDGWAISTHTRGLRTYLPACGPEVRVCAWVKGWASFRPNVSPAYAWEPVLLKPLTQAPRTKVFDWCGAPATTGRSVRGAKPTKFAWWLFDAAGLDPADEFIDLFPGSGAVSEAWANWSNQEVLAL